MSKEHMSMPRRILVVRVEEVKIEVLRELRDYIQESLGGDVLALSDGSLVEWLELPPLLGGVAVEPKEPPASSPPLDGFRPLKERDIGPLGRNSNEKRKIMNRLKAYREKHGLGCWAAVVKASGGKISDDQLRGMHDGTVVLPVSEWRQAAKALDKLEAADV